MLILGLNHGELNSSAALYKDGKIIAGATEERFNREKMTTQFPRQVVEFCLQYAGIEFNEIDCIAQGWNPGAGWHNYNPLLSSNRIKREDYFYTVPDHLFNLTQRNIQDWVLMDHPKESNIPPIYFIQHHRSHAANAFFLSSFEEAAIMTADWSGEFECLTLGVGRGNEIDISVKQHLPHSLGMMYSAFTELLGYRPDNDEWKVMALSAFDVNCDDYVKKVRSTIELEDDGMFKLDQSYYKGALLDQPKQYTDKLVKLLGNKEGVPGADPDDWHIAVAKAMQIVVEEIATHILCHFYKRVKCKNLVLGGGFFLNSVYNGKILEQTPFENLYISHTPSDAGNSIGAALYVAHCIKDQNRDYSFNSSYIGPSYCDEEILSSLIRRSISYQELSQPGKTAAELLAKDEIVAHFNGRMEFGERALGNRSILADPRSPHAKGRINSMIKYRESYRPFAPAVLADRVSDYFEVAVNYECHFMEKVVQMKDQYCELFPAVAHVDGSGRVQTVSKKHNNVFYNLIAEFEKLTQYPIVLNTSFNISGEPIVATPDDALNTFFNSGLLYMILGKYLIEKK